MAYQSARLKKTIRQYIEALRGQISVDRVILFGSYAWGEPRDHSDVDLAVFSHDFRDKDEVKNMQDLFKIASRVDPIIEPHPFHPRELRHLDKRTLLYQIVTRGKKIPL